MDVFVYNNVPKWTHKVFGLKGVDCLVFSQIYGYTVNKKTYRGSITKLSDDIGIARPTVSTAVTKLISRGLIVELARNGKKEAMVANLNLIRHVLMPYYKSNQKAIIEKEIFADEFTPFYRKNYEYNEPNVGEIAANLTVRKSDTNKKSVRKSDTSTVRKSDTTNAETVRKSDTYTQIEISYTQEDNTLSSFYTQDISLQKSFFASDSDDEIENFEIENFVFFENVETKNAEATKDAPPRNARKTEQSEKKKPTEAKIAKVAAKPFDKHRPHLHKSFIEIFDNFNKEHNLPQLAWDAEVRGIQNLKKYMIDDIYLDAAKNGENADYFDDEQILFNFHTMIRLFYNCCLYDRFMRENFTPKFIATNYNKFKLKLHSQNSQNNFSYYAKTEPSYNDAHLAL